LFFFAVYFLIIADSLKKQRLTTFEYLLLLLVFVLGLMLVCSSNDLLTVYLAIELVSLSCCLIAVFKKTSSYSTDGSIKYFVTGVIASAFVLLRSSFVYGLIGSLNFLDFFDSILWRCEILANVESCNMLCEISDVSFFDDKPSLKPLTLVHCEQVSQLPSQGKSVLGVTSCMGFAWLY